MKGMAKNTKNSISKSLIRRKKKPGPKQFSGAVIHALLKVVETRNRVNFDNPCKKNERLSKTCKKKRQYKYTVNTSIN